MLTVCVARVWAAGQCGNGCKEVQAYMDTQTGKCNVFRGEHDTSCVNLIQPNMWVIDGDASAVTCESTTTDVNIYTCNANHCTEACTNPGGHDTREMESPATVPNGPNDPCTGPFPRKWKGCVSSSS